MKQKTSSPPNPDQPNTQLINPNSEYYRKCLYCGNEFMARDLRQKYCCTKHHNDYHNRRRRFNKASEPVRNNFPIPINEPTEQKIIDLKWNIAILQNYGIGRDGIWVSYQELADKGFRFNAYNSRFPSSTHNDSFLCEYGPYIISRETKESLIIRTKTI